MLLLLLLLLLLVMAWLQGLPSGRCSSCIYMWFAVCGITCSILSPRVR